jgi:hypothetical protein
LRFSPVSDTFSPGTDIRIGTKWTSTVEYG